MTKRVDLQSFNVPDFKLSGMFAGKFVDFVKNPLNLLSLYTAVPDFPEEPGSLVKDPSDVKQIPGYDICFSYHLKTNYDNLAAIFREPLGKYITRSESQNLVKLMKKALKVEFTGGSLRVPMNNPETFVKARQLADMRIAFKNVK